MNPRTLITLSLLLGFTQPVFSCSWLFKDKAEYSAAVAELEADTKARALELLEESDLVFVGWLETLAYEQSGDTDKVTAKFTQTRDIKGESSGKVDLSWSVNSGEPDKNPPCDGFFEVDIQEGNTYLIYVKDGEPQRANLYLEFPFRVITANQELEWIDGE